METLDTLAHIDLAACAHNRAAHPRPDLALPPNVLQQPKAIVNSPALVQLVYLVDVTLTDEQRHRPEDVPPPASDANRMLKISLTDGVVHATAIEYKRIEQLSADTPLGTKLLLHNATARHGTLLLTPECATLIGGIVVEC